MATEKITLKTASVLAFERKLDLSDALFFAGSWETRDSSAGWTPVTIIPKSVRGTISNRLKTKDQDPAKLDAAIEQPNLQTVEVASLPVRADTLKVMFTMRVLGGAGMPSACNNADYKKKLMSVVGKYTNEIGFSELALRYAHNLANGRFLWRNRIGAEQIEVRVEQMRLGSAENIWTFDSLQYSLREFTTPASDREAIQSLSDAIERGLTGQGHVLLQVTAFARIGAAQEVYPSQELILDKANKSKTLYQVQGVAGIHSQKLGNALRTIDTWHPDAAELGPISIEPYGSVTTLGKACRKPSEKVDFYSLLDSWILKDKTPEPAQQHYVIATLIRGGVFGDAEKG